MTDTGPSPHAAPEQESGRARELADAVAAAVVAHPAVARLDGGPFGSVATLLPGRRRVQGVRVGARGEPTLVAVVVRRGPALDVLAGELAALVRGVLGPVPVDVTFADVVPGEVPDRSPRHLA